MTRDCFLKPVLDADREQHPMIALRRMKLLFAHNLSRKLVPRRADLFPDSTQTGLLGFGTVDDVTLWNHARTNEFMIVSHDRDFADLAS